MNKTWNFKNNPPTTEEYVLAIETMREQFRKCYKDDSCIRENYMLELRVDEEYNRLHMVLVPRHR